MDAAQAKKVLGLLGLGARARLVVVGVDRVRDAAKRGTVRVAVLGADASHHSLEKVERLLEARRVPTLRVASAIELGEAVGKASTAVVAVLDKQLAAGILAAGQSPDAVQSGSRRKG